MNSIIVWFYTATIVVMFVVPVNNMGNPDNSTLSVEIQPLWTDSVNHTLEEYAYISAWQVPPEKFGERQIIFNNNVLNSKIEPGWDIVIMVELKDNSAVIEASESPGHPKAMINVTNIRWNGLPWYEELDETVWHKNRSDDSPDAYYSDKDPLDRYEYREVKPYRVFLTINAWYVTLNRESRYYFAPGDEVTWNLYIGNKTYKPIPGDPQNGTWEDDFIESKKYKYLVKGAWPYKPPEPDLFEKNIDLNFVPKMPNMNDTVNISIRSKVDIPIAGAYVDAMLTKPDGTVKRWGFPFEPEDRGPPYYRSWPAWNATSQIPGSWNQPPGTTIKFNVTAWDRDDTVHLITSRNYTYVISSNGTWKYPENFTLNIAIDTNPKVIKVKDANVSMNDEVNVTIRSVYINVPIKRAILNIIVTDPVYPVPRIGGATFTILSTTEQYAIIGTQSPGVNVTFYIQAWDFNETMITSPQYRYRIRPITDIPGEGLGCLNVRVYDAYYDRPVAGVNVTYMNTTMPSPLYTTTDIIGMSYPELKTEEGKRIIIYPTLNETYKIVVKYNYTLNNEVKEEYVYNYTANVSIPDEEYVIIAEKGFTLKRNGCTLVFIFNVPREPPVYSEINMVFPTLPVIGGVITMIALAYPVYSIFEKYRRKAHEEERRLTK